MTAERETPLTDALFKRHSEETKALVSGRSDELDVEHAIRQVSELLDHARLLERDRARLMEALRGAIAVADRDINGFIKARALLREMGERK